MSDAKKSYGKVPVGSKGQIVIPAEARRAINIKPGDNVILISGPLHHNTMITIIPENEFSKFLKFFEESVEGLKKAASKQ